MRFRDVTWIKQGKRRQYHREGDIEKIMWDAIPEATMPAGKYIEPLDRRKWNKDVFGAWRKDLCDLDYGLRC